MYLGALRKPAACRLPGVPVGNVSPGLHCRFLQPPTAVDVDPLNKVLWRARDGTQNWSQNSIRQSTRLPCQATIRSPLMPLCQHFASALADNNMITHDSGSLWIATPSTHGFFIRYLPPVSQRPENVEFQFLSLRSVTNQTFSAAIRAARKASFRAVSRVRFGVSIPERYGNSLSNRRSLSESLGVDGFTLQAFFAQDRTVDPAAGPFPERDAGLEWGNSFGGFASQDECLTI